MNHESPEQQNQQQEHQQPDQLSDESTEHAKKEAPAAYLTDMEARLLGALLEKQLATPDTYPLTVNSLVGACNQKTNREPVTSFNSGEVLRCLRQLETRRLVRYEMGARTERYEQRLTNELNLSKKQHALVAMMMLRGPQTPNELMTRCQRMYEFTDRDDMMVSLERLTQGEKPLAILIARQAGQREDRYAHLLCGTPTIPQASASTTRASTSSSNSEITQLKERITTLEAQVAKLYQLTGNQPDTHNSDEDSDS